MYVLKKEKKKMSIIILSVIKNHDIVHQAYCPTLLSSFLLFRKQFTYIFEENKKGL